MPTPRPHLDAIYDEIEKLVVEWRPDIIDAVTDDLAERIQVSNFTQKQNHSFIRQCVVTWNLNHYYHRQNGGYPEPEAQEKTLWQKIKAKFKQ